MSTFAIILGVLGVILTIFGLISVRAGRPPALSWGGIAVGVILIIAAAVTTTADSSETTTPEPAAEATTEESTPAAAESDTQESELPVILPDSTPDNLSELKVIHEFTTGVANFDGFRLVEVRAYGPQDAQIIDEGEIVLKLNQEIYVEFQVKNLRKGPVVLQKGFVGAFDPREEEREFGAMHEGVEVARFQEYQVGVTITLDQPGEWTLWPCYQLVEEDSALRNRCTEKWQFFTVTIEE